MCTHTCKRRNRTAHIECRHGFLCFFHNELQAVGRGIYIFFIVHIQSGRTNQQIAVHSGRHQNALTHFIGTLENGVICHIAEGFIQQIILAFACHQRDGIVANHARNVIGVNACGIYNIFCGNFTE